jgi:signal transduction histidine kinase
LKRISSSLAQPIRVALAATIVVGVAWVLISMAVIAVATADLTSQIDARLTGSFDRLPPPGTLTLPPQFQSANGARPFGPLVFIWQINADGTVTKADSMPDLPSELASVTDPQDATIDGVSVRVAGRQVGDTRLVLAQSLEPVSDAQRTIVLGTLAIAPFLLAFVFIGAVAVGRRVARPLEAAHQRQLDFTADASHELRTPLAVIEATASLAVAEKRDADWYESAIVGIDREAKRMRRLVDDMLWLARFDAAGAAIADDDVDLATITGQTADRFRPIAAMHQLDLIEDIDTLAVPVPVRAEFLDRLTAVLLDNACKYTPASGTVRISAGFVGSRPTLTVEDSGPGVADADVAHIFDRFHRLLNTADSADGAGLGLAIADAVVRSTRAKWLVGRSSLGGASFSVRWPPSMARSSTRATQLDTGSASSH